MTLLPSLHPFSPRLQVSIPIFEQSYGGSAADARASLKGSFVVFPYNGVGSPQYDSMHGRLRARYPTPAPPCGTTAVVTDDDGNAIDLQDHDTNPGYVYAC